MGICCESSVSHLFLLPENVARARHSLPFYFFLFSDIEIIFFFEGLILVLNFFIKRDIGFLYELIFLMIRNDIS